MLRDASNSVWISKWARAGSHTGPRSIRGFTLLEVLVAITIMALMLASLLPVFQRGMKTLESSEQRTKAMLLAQSTLAEAGVTDELTPKADGALQAEGEHGRFRWHLDMTRYADDALGSVENDTLVVWDTRVTVSWEDGRRSPSVVLRSLKLGLLK